MRCHTPFLHTSIGAKSQSTWNAHSLRDSRKRALNSVLKNCNFGHLLYPTHTLQSTLNSHILISLHRILVPKTLRILSLPMLFSAGPPSVNVLHRALHGPVLLLHGRVRLVGLSGTGLVPRRRPQVGSRSHREPVPSVPFGGVGHSSRADHLCARTRQGGR